MRSMRSGQQSSPPWSAHNTSSTTKPRTASSRASLSSPLLPVSTGRLSIRSPVTTPPSPLIRFQTAVSNRPRPRRAALILLGVTLLGLVLWRRSVANDESRALAASEAEKCRTFPWMARCREGKAAKDPFEGLHFEREGGHMYYPAHSAASTSSREALPPAQPHPIHMLMEEASRKWQKKLTSQSKSLREAVEEYERRYGMRPPKSFADWYAFAVEKEFILIDEFDSLHERILPYLAVPAAWHHKRADKLQHDEEFWLQDKTFTLVIQDGKAEAVGPMADNGNGRAKQMLGLLEGVLERMGDMNVTFTGHDVPWVGLAGPAREAMVAKAKAGEFLSEAEFDDYQDDWDYDGWASICPSTSLIRAAKKYDLRAETWTPPKPSFIYDHVATMDVCSHPEQQPIHGFTAWPGPRPSTLFPIFSFTGTTMHADFLAPPIDQYDFSVGDDPDWDDKPFNKVVWRGTTTGADLNLAHMRKWSQRPRLCDLMRQAGHLTLPLAPHDTPGNLGPTTEFTASAEMLASSYFDFQFLGEPQQCADPVACQEFKEMHKWDSFMSKERQNQYKYVIDVDGNGWSGRFHRLLSSKVMVLKSTIFPEWYSDHIQPWLHYVPVSIDYTDLWPIMAFFRGDESGEGAHDQLAKKIALEGKHWAERHWRWEDMQVYLYRLLIEYERIMSPSRDEANPHGADM